MPTVWSNDEIRNQRVKWSDISARLPAKRARRPDVTERRRYFVAPAGLVDVTFAKRRLPPDEVFETASAIGPATEGWLSQFFFWRRA